MEKGYGKCRRDGKKQAAHRVAYELVKGKIPSGMYVLHTCDNTSCVNPDHLVAGTHADNMTDRSIKCRQTKGSRIHSAKLTEKDVRTIKQMIADGQSQVQIAELFDVSEHTVWRIKSGRGWKHVLL